MNTNVGNMPLEVYSDYISEYTSDEWNVDYIVTAIIGYGHRQLEVCGHNYGYYKYGYGYSFKDDDALGNGFMSDTGNGYESNDLIGFNVQYRY